MGNYIQVGTKSPTDDSVQVKFLINIPVKVESVDQANERCNYLLDALSKGFKKENNKCINDKQVKDAAVIFGLNGKHTPELAEDLKKLRNFTYDYEDTDIKYKIITYTWGKGGVIAKKVPNGIVPYQDIRQHLKSHAVTKELVKQLRGEDPGCLIYFSFVDSDTVEFNYIYSEYVQIVKEEMKKSSIPPTVMSTGYEYPLNSKYYKASWLDRKVRAAIAEVHPLLVYYPEPNFCVLVREEDNTIEESFIKDGRNNKEYNMESPVLIKQLKSRTDFKAVFTWKNPIIIRPSKTCTLRNDGLETSQSVLNGRTLAIGAYCNGVLKSAETYTKGKGPNIPKPVQGVYLKNIGFLIELFYCKDDAFEELSVKNPFFLDGERATKLVDAVKVARKLKKICQDKECDVLKLNELFDGLKLT